MNNNGHYLTHPSFTRRTRIMHRRNKQTFLVCSLQKRLFNFPPFHIFPHWNAYKQTFTKTGSWNFIGWPVDHSNCVGRGNLTWNPEMLEYYEALSLIHVIFSILLLIVKLFIKVMPNWLVVFEPHVQLCKLLCKSTFELSLLTRYS